MKLAIISLFCLGFCACGKPERPHPDGPGVSQAALAAKVEQVPKVAIDFKESLLTAEQRAVVVAKIGDQTITLGDLEAKLAQEPAVVRSQYASVQKRKDYLAKLVQFEVLAAEGRRQGLDKDPEVVEQVKQYMVRKYLAEAVKDNVKPELIADAELKQYYDANLALYHKPEQVEVSHMLFADKAKAEKVAAELRVSSEGNTGKLVALWNDYVVRLSEDKATSPQLGSLGLLSKEPPQGATEAELAHLRAVPMALSEAAFTRNPYEMGAIVQTDRGFHLLMLTSKSPAVDRPFDEVKESIRARIVKRQRDVQRDNLLADLRTKAKVEVNDDAVRLIPQPPADRPMKGDGAARKRDQRPPAENGAP